MIQVIGIKRFIILLVMFLINASLGATLYLYTLPENMRTEQELRSLRGQVSSVQSDIDRIQIEFEQLDEQQARFDALKDRGFFSNQERSDAKQLFSLIQDESEVISAIVSVKSGAALDDTEAQKANHKVLLSPVEITIESFDDATIYKYLRLVQERFPGYMSVESIRMERLQDVSAPVLRAIASGSNVSLVRATVELSWRTLIPESQILTNGGNQ